MCIRYIPLMLISIVIDFFILCLVFILFKILIQYIKL
jgi:hypothetical protein